MVKNIVRKTFRQALLEEPKEIVKTAVEQATAKSEKEAEPVQETPLFSKEEEGRRQQLAKKRLAELEAELKVLREGRERQEAERRIQGEEEAQETFQVEIEAQKKEPPVVAAAKRKAGTGERRIKLASG